MRIIPLALALVAVSLATPSGLGADILLDDPEGDAVVVGTGVPDLDCYAASADILSFSRAVVDDLMTVRMKLADLSEAKLDCAGFTTYGGDVDVNVYMAKFEGETFREVTEGVALFAQSTGFGFAFCAMLQTDDPSECIGSGHVYGTVLEWVVPLAGTASFENDGTTETRAYDLRGLEVETDVGASYSLGGVGLAYDGVDRIPKSRL